MKMVIDLRTVQTSVELKDMAQLWAISLNTILNNAHKKRWELRNLKAALEELPEEIEEPVDEILFIDDEIREVERVLGLLTELKVTPPERKYAPTLSSVQRLLRKHSKNHRFQDS